MWLASSCPGAALKGGGALLVVAAKDVVWLAGFGCREAGQGAPSCGLRWLAGRLVVIQMDYIPSGTVSFHLTA